MFLGSRLKRFRFWRASKRGLEILSLVFEESWGHRKTPIAAESLTGSGLGHYAKRLLVVENSGVDL